MSWIARSLANSLKLDENDIVPIHTHDPPTPTMLQPQEKAVGSEEGETHGRGVKEEDVDEIFNETLTCQIWGMASFLSPPPSSSRDSSPQFVSSNQSDPDSISHHSLSPKDLQHLVNTRPEIPNLFSREYSSFGSDFQGNREIEMEDHSLEHAVGITEEVLAFAMNISMHPETWLDFPIEEDDTDDFVMSEPQQEHAMVIERLTPRLAALRIELCPFHMSESYFWKVYFVLLYSRLNKQDAGILSTPQVMAARAMWMQELHKQMKPDFENFGRSIVYSRDNAQHDDFAPSSCDDAYSDEMPHWKHGYETTSMSMMADYETDKHTIGSSGTHFMHESVIEENPIIKNGNKDIKRGRYSHVIIQDYDGDIEWPEDDFDLEGHGGTTLPLVNEEDISFSDLEDDDYDIKPISSNTGSKVV